MSTTRDVPELKPKDFKGSVHPDWCPGCGDFGVLAALQRTCAELGKRPHELLVVSGIGCSSNFPGYFNAYGMHTLHGRALHGVNGWVHGNKLSDREVITVVANRNGRF